MEKCIIVIVLLNNYVDGFYEADDVYRFINDDLNELDDRKVNDEVNQEVNEEIFEEMQVEFAQQKQNV